MEINEIFIELCTGLTTRILVMGFVVGYVLNYLNPKKKKSDAVKFMLKQRAIVALFFLVAAAATPDPVYYWQLLGAAIYDGLPKAIHFFKWTRNDLNKRSEKKAEKVEADEKAKQKRVELLRAAQRRKEAEQEAVKKAAIEQTMINNRNARKLTNMLKSI